MKIPIKFTRILLKKNNNKESLSFFLHRGHN